MKRRFVSFALAACMVAGMLTGCNGGTKNAETGSTTGAQQETQASGDTTAADGEVVKEAPMLQEMVTSGTIPALEERLPAEADVYVEEEYSPKDETPVYGGTMRTPNAGMWYFGPIAEEPLFRMLDDGVIDFLKTTREQMKKYRREIQMIFQDPYASLDPRMTVFDIISEPLRYNSKLSKREIEEAVDKIAEQVGLNKAYLRRYPHAFSGGQRQRIGIARSLILQPKVIVCDEAVSALDVSIQAQIINLLEELQEEYNLTYLFISHALSVVRHISDRVMVMYLGRMVELAETEELFEHPMHPYTKALLSAAPKPDPDAVIDRIVLEGEVPNPANPPEGCHFHPRCRYKTERCMKEYPPLREYSGRWVACWNCESCQGREEEKKES